jgi:hypothetical protein
MKKKKAIVKVAPQTVVTLEAIEKAGNAVLTMMADVLSLPDCPPEALVQVLAAARQLEKGVKQGIEPHAKAALVGMLKDRGQQVGEGNARALQLGGWEVKMRPYRTGFDPKKLEALLRAMGKNPESFMRTDLTYSIDEGGIKRLIDHKVLTPDELETCRYAESWTLETPERI